MERRSKNTLTIIIIIIIIIIITTTATPESTAEVLPSQLHSPSSLPFSTPPHIRSEHPLTSAVVEDNTGKVVQAKVGVDGGLGLQVVLVLPMVLMKLLQHRRVRALSDHHMRIIQKSQVLQHGRVRALIDQHI